MRYRRPSSRLLLPATLAVAISATVALLPAVASASSPAANDVLLGPNLLRNSDFIQGMSGWLLEQMKPAAASFEVLGANAAPPGVSGGVVRVDVTALGAEKWHVQLEQRGLDLQEGEPYTLAFWACADHERPISLNVNVDVGDGHGVGLTQDAVSIGTAWRKYMYTFTAGQPVKDHCRVTVLLGEARGPVLLAGFVLRHGKPTIPVGPNLVRNGTFDTGLQPWIFDAHAPARGAVDLLPASSAPPGVPSRVAHADLQGLGAANWHLQLAQTGLSLDQGECYSLSFWARADRVRPLSVQASADIPDWHRIAPDSFVSLSNEWKRFELLLTAAHPIEHHSRIVFVLGDALGSVDLAGITLRHEALRDVAAKSADPPVAPQHKAAAAAPHPLVGIWESAAEDPTKRVRFTFNSDGTGSIRAAVDADPASNVPRAPIQDTFRWYLADGDHRVVVGTQTYGWQVAGGGPAQRLTLTDTRGKAHTLVRR